MTDQTKRQKVEKFFKKSKNFEVHDVTRVNLKPHPYRVGARHIDHASKNHGGMLGEATLKAVPCAHPGCTLSYEEHVSDLVCFLQMKRNVYHRKAQVEFQKFFDKWGDNIIDGFAFVETEENYRFTDEEGNVVGEKDEEGSNE